MTLSARIRHATVAVGAAMISLAVLAVGSPAQASNPPWSGCPVEAICLYQDVAGITGSKFIIDLSSNTVNDERIFPSTFRNGEPAQDATTSVFDNTVHDRYSAQFFLDNGTQFGEGGEIKPGQMINYGCTMGVCSPFSKYNDRLSGVRVFRTPPGS
jgi:hypothetical protein